MIKKLITGIKNRLPGGIDFRSLIHSIRLYCGNTKCDFYKKQFKHNIKAYCSTKYTPMKYELVDKIVPPTLYHVTPKENKEKILHEGLKAFSNPAVFLTDSITYVEYLQNIQFNGECVVLEIASGEMKNDGFIFYNDIEESRNIIWVTEYVPSKYIIEKRKGFNEH